MTSSAASAPVRARPVALVAEVFAPAPLVLCLLVLAGWRAAGWTGALWGLGTAVLVASLPMLVLRVLARRGRVDGHFVRSRAQRLPVYAATGVLTALVVAAELRLGVPVLVPVTTAFVLLGLLVLLVVTLRWKVSAHVAMAACWAVGLGALAAPWAVPLAAPVPVLVALSRVRTGDHTRAQTVVGALIGVLIGLAYTAAVASLR
ncbi:phosphatase PAP2 family protein [Kocuria turfanensis]|uniref:phosphatase PAP2 family protein n=1 Tax=Kocuria turfanensis TaxID=388357 RepID=UPI00403532E0